MWVSSLPEMAQSVLFQRSASVSLGLLPPSFFSFLPAPCLSFSSLLLTFFIKYLSVPIMSQPLFWTWTVRPSPCVQSYREEREEDNELPTLQIVSYRGVSACRELSGRGNKEVVLWEELGRTAEVGMFRRHSQKNSSYPKVELLALAPESGLSFVLTLANGH